jgi:hypothetical protein
MSQLVLRETRQGPTTWDRFYSKVNREGPVQPHRPDLDNCWEWIGLADRWGYGRFQMENRLVMATHVALLLDGRPLEDGKWALHHCDNSRCVRPTHLYHGTVIENARDARVRHRAANDAMRHPKTHCPAGHPYDEANTTRDRLGKRYCRACRNARSKARYQLRAALRLSSKADPEEPAHG